MARRHRGRRFWQGNPFGLPDQVVVFNAPDEDAVKACPCKGGDGLGTQVKQNPVIALTVAAVIGYLLAKR